ncbi:MAG TPA: beta-N-acetylglucosaminidase domain-containing protein, partial [Kribbella sp.]|nr:beta-N-acetylglucosaminidase domain-containing protein [Kribbella sp.]
WTGVGVVPRTITGRELAGARATFRHPLVTMDNYPVNDYAHGRILLADYSNREPGLADQVVGVISNPMNQAAASKLALYSFAEFGWNPATYDQQASWHRAIAERANNDPETIAALEVFADLTTYDGKLHLENAPVLAAKIAGFWQTWKAGNLVDAIAELEPYFDAIVEAPATIRDGVPDPAFSDEAGAWLDASFLWGEALIESLRLLEGVADGNSSEIATARAQINHLVRQAGEISDSRLPHSSTHPRVGDGVADKFIADVERVAESEG